MKRMVGNKFGCKIKIYDRDNEIYFPDHDREIFLRKSPTCCVVKYKLKGKSVLMGLYREEWFSNYEGIKITWE